jgi:hydrogenase maturation protein HypF
MVARHKIKIEGIVQGVGFRPFVFRLAEERGIRGWITNTPEGVEIEAEGEQVALNEFFRDLPRLAPPHAYLDRISISDGMLPQGYRDFSILSSHLGTERTAFISPDIATCSDCLSELFSPEDRRFLYPFLNCTNCGPRYSIIQDVPYDRERTTMKAFTMCPLCRGEYEDPHNRRFHAQPNACPVCGPRLRLKGESVVGDACIQAARRFLKQGKILAIKGLGGFHLAVDATNSEAVQGLRARKGREEKPFALMVKDIQTVREFCEVSKEEEKALLQPSRPIVLLKKLPNCLISEAVAPDNKFLGVFLPYTPLHSLLFFCGEEEKGNRLILVMTSGNLSEEPLAYKDEEAESRLEGIADDFLLHNREIHTRSDDSVVRVVAGEEMILRRSRGYAPRPVRLLYPSRAHILGCGAELKNTVCLYKGQNAFLSQHLGDLENYETFSYFTETIQHLERILEIQPQAVAHDLHPGYLSTQYALTREGVKKIPIQHHHAHLCSAMAEHQLEGPCIGIICDGTGYGTDGKIWGCEFLAGDYFDFHRLGHLKYMPLPGGAVSIRKPYRMALSYLYAIYGQSLDDCPLCQRFPSEEVRVVRRLLEGGFNSPMVSSLGRLFDAVSSLLQIRDEITFEGQAALALEMSVEEGWEGCYEYGLERGSEGYIVDPIPLISGIIEDLKAGASLGRMAASFHNTVVQFLLEAAKAAAKETKLNRIVLSGGVFQNVYLLQTFRRDLLKAGLNPIIHQRVPPNDGGIALGQVAIANARVAKA